MKKNNNIKQLKEMVNNSVVELVEAWEGWCDDVADIDPVSKDDFEYDVKNHFSLIF